MSSMMSRWADRCAALMICAAVAILTLLWDAEMRVRAVSSLFRPGTPDLVAYLIARPEDCRSHHELLRTIELREVAGRIGLGGVVLMGRAHAVARAEWWLGREFPDAPSVRPSFYQRRLARDLGWHGPPRFVVLDRRSRSAALALDAPITIEQQRATRLAVIAVARR